MYNFSSNKLICGIVHETFAREKPMLSSPEQEQIILPGDIAAIADAACWKCAGSMTVYKD